MDEQKNNPNNISIVQGHGIKISEVKDSLVFEERKEKPTNIVIPSNQQNPNAPVQEVPVQEPEAPIIEPVELPIEDLEDDDMITVDATSKQQTETTVADTEDDDFDNILNNQN